MKKLLQSLLLAILFVSMVSSCNLSKTAVVRDTVKQVATTTADYYDFYIPGIGEGSLKDYRGIIHSNWDNKSLELDLIPSTIKGDEGYYILKPASLVLGDTSLEAGGPPSGNIRITLGNLKEATVPRRGN